MNYPLGPFNPPGQSVRRWRGTFTNPYPMNFMQAPSIEHQNIVMYRDQPMLQGLSVYRGPFMFPMGDPYCYPPTSSVPDPNLRSYLALM
jgi:hypothetical protein